jgi:hypothetical protein
LGNDPAGGNGGGPIAGESTNVTVTTTSVGDDWLSSIRLDVYSITLTSQSGAKVSVLGSPRNVDYLEANGNPVPLVTAAVPQDTYVSADVVWGYPYFSYLEVQPGQLSTFTDGNNGGGFTATTKFPTPIAIDGQAMTLQLDLQVSQSFGLLSAAPWFTYVPVFQMEAARNDGASGEALTDLYGQVGNPSGTGFMLNGVDGESVAVSLGSSTSFDGVSGGSALTSGTFVRVDGALQADGSVAASAVQVPEVGATTTVFGTLVQVDPSLLEVMYHFAQGSDPFAIGLAGGSVPYQVTATTYKVAGPASDLSGLPFTPAFSAATVAPGQALWVSEQAPSATQYPTASTVMLIPQSINGTVTSETASGGFTQMTVSLAGNDTLRQVNSANSVVVYLPASASAPAVGALSRFRGLLFNDGGVLRMVARTTAAGVSPQLMESVRTGGVGTLTGGGAVMNHLNMAP